MVEYAAGEVAILLQTTTAYTAKQSPKKEDGRIKKSQKWQKKIKHFKDEENMLLIA